MGKETIILGVAGIVLGIAVYIKTNTLVPSLVPIILGVTLILFYKEEDKIEQRKDINTERDNK